MKGQFNCFFVGRTLKASKSGKFRYLFVNGVKTPQGIDDPTPVEFWSEEEFKDLQPDKAYAMILDVQGDFVSFVKFA